MALELTKSTVANLPKPKTFLKSIERNSKSSKESYASALCHLANFVSQKYPSYDSETILQALVKNKRNVYELLEGFVSYLMETRVGLTPKSILLYVTAARSYFAYYDIDVIPSKFRRKVRLPKIYREDEEPLDASDIRTMLLSCNNRRLKILLLVLASGGMRIGEALAIRNMDLDFSKNPTKIHIRKEFSKTRVARDIYISQEATFFLKQWLGWKYKNPGRVKKFNQEDLVFTVYRSRNPHSIYFKVRLEFDRLLEVLEMNEKKDGGILPRNKITLHSLRRFVKTVISNQVGRDYSEWYLGHSKSPYWTLKEEQRREIYTSKCMKYLTFLDYGTLEATGKNIEIKLEEKGKEIQILKNHYDGEMKKMRDDMDRILSMIQQNPQLAHIKPERLSRKLT